tara:strand:+ start:274 stop:1146 length:873 start_codon:yes stop_codon:yes gene_type:complete
MDITEFSEELWTTIAWLTISIILLVVFLLYILPWIKRTTRERETAAMGQWSSDFYAYVHRWMTRFAFFSLFIILILGIIIRYDLTWNSVTLWLAGTGAIALLFVKHIPEVENIIAAMTVFMRNQVTVGEEFEITFPDGHYEPLTLTHRNERFSYARKFDGTRSILEIPHTTWVFSHIANLSRSGFLRWTTRICISYRPKSRDKLMDNVDEFVADSGFSNVDPANTSWNYQTKLLAEDMGHFPQQVLTVYTMVSSREYAFDNENAFMDGLVNVISDTESVEIIMGGPVTHK